MKVVPVGIWCVCVIKIISGGVNDTGDVQRIQNEKTGNKDSDNLPTRSWFKIL